MTGRSRPAGFRRLDDRPAHELEPFDVALGAGSVTWR
jgi:hypothetical protein